MMNFSVCTGIVGEIGETDDELFIWTHKKFDIGYDGNKVIIYDNL